MVTLANTGIKPPKYIASEDLEKLAKFYLVDAEESELKEKDGSMKQVVNFTIEIPDDKDTYILTQGANAYRREFVKHFGSGGGDKIGPLKLVGVKQRANSKFKTNLFADVVE